ncbi:Mitochondrial intermediate peptidase [Sporothrix epigloea]|uniref:Mitochondrial intermediate peptidase n=1 Tax=Sporothrix epigloea TaxID=1892477 RepID=A0ABP0DVB8_9PEZI
MARLRRQDELSALHRDDRSDATSTTWSTRNATLAVLLLYATGVSASSGPTTTSAVLAIPATTATTKSTSTSITATTSTASPTVYIPSDAATTGTAAATGIVRNYGYIGCFLDIDGLNDTVPGTRSLQGDTTDEVLPGDMTVAKCLAFCGGGGSGTAYTYAGLEYARECWCGQELSALAAQEVETQCNLPCDGDSNTLCGGDLRLTLYRLTSPASRPMAAIGVAFAVASFAAAQLM